MLYRNLVVIMPVFTSTGLQAEGLMSVQRYSVIQKPRCHNDCVYINWPAGGRFDVCAEI